MILKPLLYFLLPHMWYPLREIDDLDQRKINKCKIFDNEYVIYQNKESQWICHTNICPHQGADLSFGSLNNNKEIVCPYHGFVFDDGLFRGIQNHENENEKSKKTTTKKYLQCMKLMKTVEYDNMLFISNDDECSDYRSLYSPKETYDHTFRYIHGSRQINSNYLTLVENLLDNLHISFVHSFGSRMSLPTKIRFLKVDKHHGKTTFEYKPNVNSISHMFTVNKEDDDDAAGTTANVVVENEFILPTSTITRVFFGKEHVKTVFTRCSPISDTECRLYWRLYRNYWVGNEVVDKIGDSVMKVLMDQTLNEDIRILKNVNDARRVGKLNTKYDRTILEFRKSMSTILNHYGDDEDDDDDNDK